MASLRRKGLKDLIPVITKVYLDNSDGLKTTIFRKKTFTGVLTNFLSYTSFRYKKGLIQCLVERAFKINNTWLGFHNDLSEIKKILLKNSYPISLIDKIARDKLEKLILDNKANKKQENIRYFKLPYLGKQSENLSKKVNTLTKRYCKTASVNLVFLSKKIKNFFSAKDAIPSHLKSYIVYKFVCAGCNSCYIGETTRHLNVRIEEHLKKDKNSAIYKHVHKSINCFDRCNKDCFSILDTASTKFQLKIKEGMYIGWEAPDLNKQVKYVQCTLTV